MPGNPKAPEVGELVIDASEIASFVVDLPPGGMRGLRTEQPGFDDVVKEINAAQAKYGDAAGITASDIANLKTANDRVATLDRFLGPARKLVELLTESRAKADHERQTIVTDAGASVDRRAKANPELRAAYEKALAYRSATANKAAKTRKKNAAGEEADDEEPAGADAAPRGEVAKPAPAPAGDA